jgi:hypothetical protein
VMMAIHVDDCYVIGRVETINQVVKDIESRGLKLKVEYNTKDYLSCEILFHKARTVAWLGQPHQTKKIKTNYEELVKDCQRYKTPGTPNYGIIRRNKNDLKVYHNNPTQVLDQPETSTTSTRNKYHNNQKRTITT